MNNTILNITETKIETKTKIEPEPEPELVTEEFISNTENSWSIIESYYKDKHLENLVRHQIESYNNFIELQIFKTIKMFNNTRIASEQDFDIKSQKYSLELFVTFENFNIHRPQIHENNGSIKLMFPQEARKRNFTYASSMSIDISIKYIIRTGDDLSQIQTLHKTIQKIPIGKMPIMLNSNICILNQYKHIDYSHTGECKHDAGGYFIINGSEKTVLGQERAAENRIYCFNISKNTKYSWIAEIKSVPDFKCISPKQINIMLSCKNNGFGFPMSVQIPRIKQPIPLFILFRALGIIPDKNICEFILLDINNEKYKKMLNSLQASIIEANICMSKEDSIQYISNHTMYSCINTDKETSMKKKYNFTLDILNNDLYPHCKTTSQKIYFLGYMANKLLQANFEWIKADDRDSYLNKRVDLTGTLLNNLFRNYFNKVIKDFEKQTIREINTGSWKSTDDYLKIISKANINKFIKHTTIENGLKRALSTGDFSIKHSNSSKVGVAQVLTRLTYISAVSHLRRISTPVDKSGKLIPPRKLHNTSWGFCCCLTGDAEILLSNKIDTKKIMDIKDGDWVNTVNRKTLADEPSQIHSFFSKMPDKLYELTTICGKTIKATPDHPFLINIGFKKYMMINFGDLHENDKVIIRNNNGCISTGILSIKEVEPELVYDFTTYSNNHSFVASSFVVSNCTETPEGASVGIVKNLSLMAHITIYSNSSPIYDYIQGYIINIETIENPFDLFNKVKVFVNGAWVGITENPIELYSSLKEKKQSGVINIYTSVIFDYKFKEIRVCNDGGRLTRPVFRIKDNKTLVTKKIMELIGEDKLSWNDLLINHKIDNSIIEYIDPEEQSHSMIAMKTDYLVKSDIKYNFCEIHPSCIFGVAASLIPFPDHNQSPRNTYQAAQSKQAMGIYASNFQERMDKTAYVSSYVEKPLIETRVMNMLKINELPAGTNIIVALATHTGFNQEDSVLVNQGSIDRGLFMTTIYHTEKDEDKQKTNGDEEIRCRPDKNKTKGTKIANYDKLNSKGVIPENTRIENRDIIISKVIPIKENRNNHTKLMKFEDQSKVFRSGGGETYVDKNYIDSNGDGYKFCKVRTRELRKPVIGDKFSNRSAQKSTCGNIIAECDMPFTASGMKPDLIINPHAIPSRMTMGMLKEMILCKVLVALGLFGDGTSFGELSVKSICDLLLENNFENNGNEMLYCGLTGEQHEVSVFMGPCFYQRLKHMVADKVHSRASGPMVAMSHQPAEGRSRDGGLRLGEMEKDGLVAHGVSNFIRDRFYKCSDKYSVHVCNKCGQIVAYNDAQKIHLCRYCENRTDFAYVEIPYCFKLLTQELMTMNISPRLLCSPH